MENAVAVNLNSSSYIKSGHAPKALHIGVTYEDNSFSRLQRCYSNRITDLQCEVSIKMLRKTMFGTILTTLLINFLWKEVMENLPNIGAEIISLCIVQIWKL